MKPPYGGRIQQLNNYQNILIEERPEKSDVTGILLKMEIPL